ncbi:MAG: hypothetical protein WAN36_11655, partial [Calditrichia bacterium]
VSDAVKTLEGKGLIRKTASRRDKRRSWLNLTGSGKEITSGLSGWQDSMQKHLLQFPLQTRQTVMIFLLRFLESLKKDGLLSDVKSCFSCRYFQKDVKGGEKNSHHCIMRDVPVKDMEVRLNCPSYQKYI